MLIINKWLNFENCTKIYDFRNRIKYIKISIKDVLMIFSPVCENNENVYIYIHIYVLCIHMYTYIYSMSVFFHAHSQFIGQQGKGEAIPLTPLYPFHLLHRP